MENVKALKVKIKELENKIKILEEQIENSEDEDQIEALEDQIENLEEQIEDAEERIETLEDQIEDEEDQIENSKYEGYTKISQNKIKTFEPNKKLLTKEQQADQEKGVRELKGEVDKLEKKITKDKKNILKIFVINFILILFLIFCTSKINFLQKKVWISLIIVLLFVPLWAFFTRRLNKNYRQKDKTFIQIMEKESEELYNDNNLLSQKLKIINKHVNELFENMKKQFNNSSNELPQIQIKDTDDIKQYSCAWKQISTLRNTFEENITTYKKDIKKDIKMYKIQKENSKLKQAN
ncbi:hypothetical protein [Candidatus Phytoplasma meliae]|uniref:Uncharacterized protein n=1 Tax=Candidatus Phytoplasma meliae TaxID=1848402 RepID=A0ABS5CY11_9MOLU|nr:hypothetical protein [Candidatus Phytoplasma meliae]MBP5835865.1 hypothetical protein [Candidatus Phytoplasma meliae]